ncbi:MAG: TRAP transporter fused permease subunit [Nitriliruptorales bacterium]|nr:TRAP transporter fused permease subunit [Nitriliruptorales bacterium]
MSEKLQQTPVLRTLAALFAVMYVISAVSIVPYQMLVGGFIGITFALIFMLYPARRGKTKERITVFDVLWALAALGIAGYFIVQYDAIQMRTGFLTDLETYIASLAVLVSLEVARRVLGWVLPTLAVLFLAYNFLGPQLPGFLSHPGFTYNRLMGASFTGTGLFGLVASVYARYVVLFVVFGSLMQAMGVINAILDLARALTAKLRAGSAKAAILASAGVGSVVGQGVANIAITAPMTVPLMKKSGFSSERAGGLEVVASVGGQLLPPVMGAGAFLVAQFAGVSYANVVTVALAPAILLYAGLLASAHFEAGVEQVGYVEGGAVEAEGGWNVFKRTYWAFLPILMLMGLLFAGMSPFRAAFWAIVSVAALLFVRTRSPKETAVKAFEGLSNGTFSMLGIASTAGVIGLVIAMVNLPGLPITFSQNAFGLVRGSLIGAYFMVVLISLVMGMGMTVTASYVVVAVLAAPLLGEFGVPVLVAHLVVFWLSQDSSVTPPFALGSFVVAGISKGDVWKTSWHAFKFAKPLYIVPLLMIYSPIMSGEPLRVLLATVIGAIGLIFAAAAFAGFYKAPLNWPLRLLLAAAATATLWPETVTSAAGIAAGLALWGFQRWQNVRRVGHADLLTPEVAGRTELGT